MTSNGRKAPRLGTVNGFAETDAWLNGEHFTYDGTTRGLVRAARSHGAEAGDLVATWIMSGAVYEMQAAPHDDREGGYWAGRRYDLEEDFDRVKAGNSSPRP